MGASTHEHGGVLSDIGLPERYSVVRRIARGGMASVWCARDLVLGREVAIKLLAEPFLADPNAVHRFQREARAAAHLSGHANVVTIFDVGQTEVRQPGQIGRPFIVMAYLSGGTVADALRAGAVARADALCWLTQAAEALDYAHDRGVIHRDIKPANLLLDARRVLHVADFGIARVGTEDPITSAGALFGTAAYFSPEQAMGRPATAASDRYALAVVAYELLVGERPFRAELFAAQARQHAEDTPAPASERNPALPLALDDVLARGMAKPPGERWSSAREFAAAVEAAMAESRAPAAARTELPAPPVFTTHRSSRGGQRRPRALAVAALAAGAAAVALALALATGGGGPSPSVRTAHAGTRASAGQATGHPSKPVAKQPTAARAAASSSASGASSANTSTAQGSSVPPNGASAPTGAVSPGDAGSLQARGHQLMLNGDYGGAVAALRQAVAAGPASGLTYAYALYDLGRSLRLGGDPRAAAVVLQRRLQIPNQTDVVRQELQLALQAIGAQANSGTGSHRGD